MEAWQRRSSLRSEFVEIWKILILRELEHKNEILSKMLFPAGLPGWLWAAWAAECWAWGRGVSHTATARILVMFLVIDFIVSPLVLLYVTGIVLLLINIKQRINKLNYEFLYKFLYKSHIVLHTHYSGSLALPKWFINEIVSFKEKWLHNSRFCMGNNWQKDNNFSI